MQQECGCGAISSSIADDSSGMSELLGGDK